MTAEELKKYLIKNNLTFSEYILDYMSKLNREKMLQDPDYDGPFCPCCGESQKNRVYHNEECIWRDK